MKVFAKTDKGLVRSSNQDAFSWGEFDGGVWAVVCDGMGGANGGDFASTKAVEIIGERIKSEINPQMSGNSIRDIFQKAVAQANAQIFRTSLEIPSLAGMGTTVVLAAAIGQTVYIAHAGDSRAYKLSKAGISLLTRDHSMVQQMVDMGQITEAEAKDHPRKNIITRALGVNFDVEIDHTETSVEKGDMILLCSDGLSNFVDEAEVLSIAREKNGDEIIDSYIARAYDNGGGDNITGLIICL